jgi:hypothetical protein
MSRPRVGPKAALIALAWAVAAVIPASAQFETRASFVVQPIPYSIAVGDFNHDGNIDLAIASACCPNGGISILLGRGDGTFRPAVNYPAGISPVSVVAADFNHDGNLDLAVASQSSYIGILLGNGDGTFQPATQSPPVPTFEQFVTVGDFNSDGKPDLLARADNMISVMLGNGDGTFQDAIITQPSFAIQALGVGDFNHDGKLDLATAGTFGESSFVHILLGSGDGTFSPGASYPGETLPASIAVADFNGDEKLDLAIANQEGIGISVLLGNGDGTFQAAVDYHTAFPIWVTAVDVNGDHKLDLVVANSEFSSGVSTLLGNGDGTFQSPTFYPAGEITSYVAVGDFNGDGKIDLVEANYRFDNVFVLLNTGVASFSPTDPIQFPSQMVNTESVAQKVVLTNAGTAELSISSMTASEPFQANSQCGNAVAAGASCDIEVTFKPQATGRAAGLVTIIDSASSKPQVIEVFGVGTELETSPQSLKFPAQKVGTTSPPLAVKMTNHGSAAVSFNDIRIEGNNSTSFSQRNDCGKGLSPGGSCTVAVRFAPNKTGPRHATLFVNAAGSSSPPSVPLSGTGE